VRRLCPFTPAFPLRWAVTGSAPSGGSELAKSARSFVISLDRMETFHRDGCVFLPGRFESSCSVPAHPPGVLLPYIVAVPVSPFGASSSFARFCPWTCFPPFDVPVSCVHRVHFLLGTLVCTRINKNRNKRPFPCFQSYAGVSVRVALSCFPAAHSFRTP